MLHCPAKGFLDTSNGQAERLILKVVHLKVSRWFEMNRKSKDGDSYWELIIFGKSNI